MKYTVGSSIELKATPRKEVADILPERRIVGQCHQTDFAGIEHLAIALESPEMLDTSTLTNKQKFAFHFIALIIKRGVPWKMLSLVKEVLFWGNEDHVSEVEVKFIQDESKIKEIDKFKKIWHS